VGVVSFGMTWVLPLALAATSSAAPPRLDWIYPAGVRRGASVEVTVGGNFDEWPLTAWVDRAGLVIESASEKGILTVTAAAEAAPGVYLMRLHGESGGSALRSILVGTLRETIEKEPNNEPERCQRIESPALLVNGRFERRGDVDVYEVSLESGETLVADLVSNAWIGSPADAVLQLLSSDGFVIAQSDDEPGLDPRIVFRAPAAGSYLVRAFAFPEVPTSQIQLAGGDDFVYRLTFTTQGFVDYAFPLAVQEADGGEVQLLGWNLGANAPRLAVSESDVADPLEMFLPNAGGFAQIVTVPNATHIAVEPESSATSTPRGLQLPVTVSGRIDKPGDVDAFYFSAQKGDSLSIVADAWELGFALDPVLRLFDSSGELVAEADDIDREHRDAEMTHRAASDGKLRLEIGDRYGDGGPRYLYRLTLAEALPDFELSVAADAFVVKSGDSLDIPVTIARHNGFIDEIEITAVDLPAGARAEPVVSKGKGDSSKSVKLRVSASGIPGGSTTRIEGKSRGDGDQVRAAIAPVRGQRLGTTNLWLGVTPR